MNAPSLTQYFDPPDGWLGDFGWVVGYSADTDFINDAADRFTGASMARRAADGRIALALLLDAGQPGLGWTEAPGVAHLPMLDPARRGFRLLHAKVALLAFRPVGSTPGWRLRLVVSTGNWTTETLTTSLDLAWCIDLDSLELEADETDLRQRCADLTAAANFVAHLRPHFDQRLLLAVEGDAARAVQRLESAAQVCSQAGSGAPARFIDNREAGFLQQLVKNVENHAGKARRNFLLMGSGFYEGTDAITGVPSVLGQIVQTLQAAMLLTTEPDISVIVNPDACQGISSCLDAMLEAWNVYPAAAPAALFGADAGRSLHAKFILGANYRETTGRCTRTWLYLGSGNLTGPGFREKASRNRGNLEAGVLFTPGDLLYEKDRKQPQLQALPEVLPVQWDDPLEPGQASPGTEMPDRPDAYAAPPVAWLQWQKTGELSVPSALQPTDQPFEVLRPDGEAVAPHGGGWPWTGGCPRVVTIRWDAGREVAQVPVQDSFGRLGALPLTAISLDEAARELARFPQRPDDDEPDDEPGDLSIKTPHQVRRGAASYPIRRLVVHLELIASRQCGLQSADWTLWCQRLEQAMTQAAESDDVVFLRQLGLNPLDVLRAGPFVPAFLRSDVASRERYEKALVRIEAAWGVAGFEPIRGSS